MIKKVSDNLWIPLWVDKWIFGSMRLECDPAERAIWIDLLALAAKDDGWIRANDETPYLLTQLAGLLVYPEEVFAKAIEKLIDKKKLGRDEKGILRIVKWEKYQLSNSYKRVIKHRIKRGLRPTRHLNETESVSGETENVYQIKSYHIKSDHIKKNIKAENIGPLFEELWKSWPKEGRFKKPHCLMKFTALCKAGKLDEFKAAHRGYLKYLEYQEKERNFKQQAMHLSTFLNNWEGDKERYIGFDRGPRL